MATIGRHYWDPLRGTGRKSNIGAAMYEESVMGNPIKQDSIYADLHPAIYFRYPSPYECVIWDEVIEEPPKSDEWLLDRESENYDWKDEIEIETKNGLKLLL